MSHSAMAAKICTNPPNQMYTGLDVVLAVSLAFSSHL